MEEFFDVYNPDGSWRGRFLRSECHGNPELIHKSVHVVVLDSTGTKILLQKRSHSKDIQPGKWDTAVGGHVAAGESVADAAIRELAEELGCDILGRVVGFAAVGGDPQIMGMGPYWSTKKLLEQTGLTIDDIDLVEINEAFASQYVACVNELGLPWEKVNVAGGAIALGHPFAASGGILTARMLYELRRRDLHRGIITFCIGGGLGVAMLVER